jgi:hypothetical protein
MGNVSSDGFEALRLSIWGAARLFGQRAAYVVCVNSVPIQEARKLTGALPPCVAWLDATDRFPHWMREHVNGEMAEGVGWKFAPVRVFTDRYELALDNDCILWEMPRALRQALAGEPARCLIAEDVRRCFGQFANLCGPEARNSGIRGTPAGFDLEAALRATLQRHPCRLASETDEQGLQIAALESKEIPLVVRTSEVSICSPFPPHSPDLGTCGAHFVGLNARSLPWDFYGRPASQVRREQWQQHRPALYERVGLVLRATNDARNGN